jgi:NAD(P)-dependent dehydrogenase (short-subunit alcohol dehydrogenase family)
MGWLSDKANGPKTDESIDMTGKVVIITGSNAGIGRYTAKILSKNGAHVIMACRNVEKANKTKQDILDENSNAQITVMKVDTSKLDTVDQFVKDFLQMSLPLHVLITNAGAAVATEEQEGLDPMFTTNHLGHYLLITKLLPLLKQTGTEEDPARIVIVSSVGHKNMKIDVTPENLEQFIHLPRKKIAWTLLLSTMGYYAFSKLANCMHCYQLNEDFKRDGVKNVVVNSLHPGAVKTDIWNTTDQLPTSEQILFRPLLYVGSYLMKDEAHGAQPLIMCATSPAMAKTSGKYFNGLEIDTYSPYVHDDNLRKQMIELCDRLISNYM